MEFHLSSLIIENGSAGGSSSGRTTGSEPVSGGSNPPPPATRVNFSRLTRDSTPWRSPLRSTFDDLTSMRTALAIFILTLTLWLAAWPTQRQIPTSGASATDTDTIHMESIQMVDAQSGWATLVEYTFGASAVLRTADGGTQWRDVTPLGSSGKRIRVWRFTALSALIAWVATAPAGDPNTEIFRTTDGGRTWNSVAIPTARSISFINPREGWLLTMGDWVWPHGSDQSILHSTDGGKIWTGVSGFHSGNSFRDWIAFLNPATGWMTEQSLIGDGLLLFVTHDGGRSWQRQEIPFPGVLTPPYSWISAQPPKFFTATVGILPVYYSVRNESGQEKMIVAFYATHDSGTTWTLTTPADVSQPLPNFAVMDMNHAWVTAGGVLQATSDGGRHWAQLPSNPLFAVPTNHTNPSMSPPVTQLDFISPDVGWAVRYARDFPAPPVPPFLLKTLDGGRTWSPVTYTISRQ